MAHDALGQDSLVGRTLGHYRVVERIGEGGMGVVYRAHDEHLTNREVAIKVLPPVSLTDAAARLRFRKEAHALSKLSHPNIATIFDFDSEDGTDFLVEELIEGISLNEMLAGGPLGVKEVIALGTQLCEGLAAAHEHGIIHRDIKPANLRVTPDAQVKIVDFGLARSLTHAEPSGKTVTMSETQIVAGTVPYLAPEQVRNEKLDARCDIWAAGCVLYEMATGRRPFLGQSTALLDGILHQAPALPSKLNHKVPAALDAIILKCLEKDSSLRYASARDVAVDLRRLALTSSTTLVISEPRKRSRKWRWILTGAAAVLVAAFLVVVYREGTLPPPRIVATRQLTHTRVNQVGQLVTDGVRVYFAERREGNYTVLAQISTGGGEATEIPTDIKSPFYVVEGISPSGSDLLVHENCCPGGDWIQPIPSGPPRRAPIPNHARAAHWASNGTLLYSPEEYRELYGVTADGAQRKRVLTASSGNIRWARVSPDGKRIRFTAAQDFFLRTHTDIMEAGIDGTHQHPVFPEMKGQTGSGDWTPNGRLFYFVRRNGTALSLWAKREPRLQFPWTHPDPTLLYAGPLELSLPTASKDGKELFVKGADRRGELSVYDPHTSKFVPYLGGISASYVVFSPDRQWIAYVSYPEGALWRSRVDGSEKMQLTFPPMGVLNPRWSPDGRAIAFNDWFGSEHAAIYIVSADGGQPSLLATGPLAPGDPTWLDSRSIVYSEGNTGTPVAKGRIETLNLDTMVSTVVPGSEGFYSPRSSPDGKYIAALSVTIDRLILYDLAQKQWRTLLRGDNIAWPTWTHDSKFVYAVCNNKVYRIKLASGKAEVIVGLEGVHYTAFSLEGFGWFGLTPDDQIMILRDTGTEEIYALELEY